MVLSHWMLFSLGVNAAWLDLQADTPAWAVGRGQAAVIPHTALWWAGYRAVHELAPSLRWSFVQAIRQADRDARGVSGPAPRPSSP